MKSYKSPNKNTKSQTSQSSDKTPTNKNSINNPLLTDPDFTNSKEIHAGTNRLPNRPTNSTTLTDSTTTPPSNPTPPTTKRQTPRLSTFTTARNLAEQEYEQKIQQRNIIHEKERMAIRNQLEPHHFIMYLQDDFMKIAFNQLIAFDRQSKDQLKVHDWNTFQDILPPNVLCHHLPQATLSKLNALLSSYFQYTVRAYEIEITLAIILKAWSQGVWLAEALGMPEPSTHPDFWEQDPLNWTNAEHRAHILHINNITYQFKDQYISYITSKLHQDLLNMIIRVNGTHSKVKNIMKEDTAFLLTQAPNHDEVHAISQNYLRYAHSKAELEALDNMHYLSTCYLRDIHSQEDTISLSILLVKNIKLTDTPRHRSRPSSHNLASNFVHGCAFRKEFPLAHPSTVPNNRNAGPNPSYVAQNMTTRAWLLLSPNTSPLILPNSKDTNDAEVQTTPPQLTDSSTDTPSLQRTDSSTDTPNLLEYQITDGQLPPRFTEDNKIEEGTYQSNMALDRLMGYKRENIPSDHPLYNP